MAFARCVRFLAHFGNGAKMNCQRYHTLAAKLSAREKGQNGMKHPERQKDAKGAKSKKSSPPPPCHHNGRPHRAGILFQGGMFGWSPKTLHMEEGRFMQKLSAFHAFCKRLSSRDGRLCEEVKLDQRFLSRVDRLSRLDKKGLLFSGRVCCVFSFPWFWQVCSWGEHVVDSPKLLRCFAFAIRSL